MITKPTLPAALVYTQVSIICVRGTCEGGGQVQGDDGAGDARDEGHAVGRDSVVEFLRHKLTGVDGGS